MSNCQDSVRPLLHSTSEICDTFHFHNCRASGFDENTTGIGEFHCPSCIASEEVKSLFFFKIGNLSAERRLGDVQSIGGPREVSLFSQGNDGVHMTYINAGKHGSKPRSDVL